MSRGCHFHCVDSNYKLQYEETVAFPCRSVGRNDEIENRFTRIYARPKSNGNEVPRWSSDMLVSELLLPPTIFRMFGPKTAIFAPKYVFLGTFRPCRLFWCPVVWLVGGCGTRAVSRKTPFYFIVLLARFGVLVPTSHFYIFSQQQRFSQIWDPSLGKMISSHVNKLSPHLFSMELSKTKFEILKENIQGWTKCHICHIVSASLTAGKLYCEKGSVYMTSNIPTSNRFRLFHQSILPNSEILSGTSVRKPAQKAVASNGRKGWESIFKRFAKRCKYIFHYW